MADEQKPVIDAFGEPRDQEGKVIPPEPPKVEEKPAAAEPKPEGEGKKSTTDDIESHPFVVGLKEQIEQVKKSMGGNLSEQRKIIERLEKDLKDARAGKKPSIEPLFKDVKRSKDLTKEQRDAMTDTEIRQMDELADMKDLLNKQHLEAQARDAQSVEDRQKAEEEAEAAEAEERAAEEFNAKAQAAAKKLAGDDTALANKIIDNFNMFRDNDKLDDAGVAERMEAAARMVPEYKAPEQKSAMGSGGTAVKSGTQADPFGVDAIIKEAKGSQAGKYTL